MSIPDTPNAPEPLELEELALALTRGAADVVRDGRRRALVIDAKSTATDLVTDVDRRTEQWLVEEIARLRPADAVLGEEGAGHGEATRTDAPVRWIVDPIDGTVNFVLGLDQYAVSVAAEVAGVIVAGAVCNPATGETFHAHAGGGAWLRRADHPTERLGGPRPVSLDRAVVATGFAYDDQVRSRQAAVLAALLPRVADIRRLGAAALDLCFVAAGRLDAHFEAGLNRWDYAAGALIAAEAGCVVSGLDGRAVSERFVAAAGPDLAAELIGLLAELGADRVRELSS